jgi:predicted lipid-binding transport protein (Tim44 family)
MRYARTLFTALVAAGLAFSIAAAEARGGKGGSFGSRGGKTFSSPPSTATAPGGAAPVQRSMTQPSAAQSRPAAAQPAAAGAAAAQTKRSMFGPGLMGGIAAGLLGAGLFGLLSGSGLFGGLGSLASFLGLALQIVLVVVLVRLAMNFFRNRQAQPAAAGAVSSERMAAATGGPQAPTGAGAGLAGAAATAGTVYGAQAQPRAGMQAQPHDGVGLGQQDFEAFERSLGEIQTAYGRGDVKALEDLVTPEVLSYFAHDIEEERREGRANRIADVRLLQGDLAEAWREGPVDYATVAMRYALRDWTEDSRGQVVDGDPETLLEVTEIWTFLREKTGPLAGRWLLSAIQQNEEAAAA